MYTYIVCDGSDGTGCIGLPHKGGSAVLVHQESRSLNLNSAECKHCYTQTTTVDSQQAILFSKLHLLTRVPLEQTRWMRVVYESFWPSESQAEPSVNSSIRRSRASMIGPRFEMPMLLTDTSSSTEPWGEAGGKRWIIEYQTPVTLCSYFEILIQMFTLSMLL